MHVHVLYGFTRSPLWLAFYRNHQSLVRVNLIFDKINLLHRFVMGNYEHEKTQVHNFLFFDFFPSNLANTTQAFRWLNASLRSYCSLTLSHRFDQAHVSPSRKLTVSM